MFLEGDDGGGFGGDGGADGGDVSHGAAVFEGEPASSGQGEPQTREPAPSSPTVDARALAHEFGSVIGQHFQPQQAPPRQITPEEARKLLNVWEPSNEWLAKYDNLETRTSALAELRDGLIRQADTIAQYRMREMMDGMQQTYARLCNICNNRRRTLVSGGLSRRFLI
jgi:hypothetical protein